MKRWMALLLAVVLTFGITACGNKAADPQATAATIDTIVQKYAGEWNANVLDSYTEGKQTYQVSSIWLHPDGLGNYNGRAATWEYSEKDNTIRLSITGAAVVLLEIAEENGKTVLKFYDATYYRANEFVEMN